MEDATMVKKRKLELSPEQQALVTDALKHFFRVGDEVDDRDVVEDQALKANAEHGRKMRRVSEVTDDELLDAYKEAKRFPGLKEQEYYRRVGIKVGLSASRVQYHLLRIGKKLLKE